MGERLGTDGTVALIVGEFPGTFVTILLRKILRTLDMYTVI